MTLGQKVVLLSGPEDDYPTEPDMRFRLTYDGKLRATQRDPQGRQLDPMSLTKHEMRRQFHGQLKRLWETNTFLRDRTLDERSEWPTSVNAPSRPKPSERGNRIRLHDRIAELYPCRKFHFLPLVLAQFELMCSLDVLFLRRDIPGSLFYAGDVDNRIKTLIDALRMPKDHGEFFADPKEENSEFSPAPDESPFYVLMEDDRQVTHVSVETDTLLDPVGPDEDNDSSRVRLVITVDLRPYRGTLFSLGFS